MALSPRLEARQSQSLVMTPELQQAIKLLQLTNLEIATYVDEQLEENPLLELAESDSTADAETAEIAET
ncbi:MAG: RNA polymerase sigma-54 factor, partial [Alphaproteobacteria bacterium]